MKAQSRKLSLLHPLLLIALCALLTAGCGSSGDSGTAYWGGGDSGSVSQGYSVSGTLRDAMTGTPVQSATCTLLQAKGGNLLKALLGTPKETTEVSTISTDQSGRYTFAGVTAGTYTISFSKTDYVTSELENVVVSTDVTNPDAAVLQMSQWSQMAGSDHPYDSQKYSATITVAPGSKAAGLSGVTASITPSYGVQIGYVTDSSPAAVDWNATSTYSNGNIFIYNLTPGMSYTITFSSPGYTIQPLVISRSDMAFMLVYQVTSTSPTPSPSPTPTPSPSSSPTPSPSPSATPTQSGGGGGGGGAGTPAITEFSPASGKTGNTITIKGTNFGSSKGTVKFNGTKAADQDVTWGDTEIKANVPAGATTGKITVTTGGAQTATSATDFTVLTNPTIGAYEYEPGKTAALKNVSGTPRGGGDQTVININDSGVGSLRQAISNVGDGYTIDFNIPGSDDKTITLTSEYLEIYDKSVTIKGPNAGGGKVTVQVDQPGATNMRVFYLNPGFGRTATLENLTIKGGSLSGSYGGSVLSSSGSATIRNCLISGSKSAFGTGRGGAVYSDSSTSVTIENSTIDSCQANRGGGIYVSTGILTILNSTISNCTSSINGAGIYATSGTAAIRNSTFSGNLADNIGGAIYNSGTLTLTDSTISGNQATMAGGIYNNVAASAYLLNNIVINNTPSDLCSSGGGGILNAYRCWYSSTEGTIGTEVTAPNQVVAYEAGKGLEALADNGGATKTMKVKDGCPAINTGTYVYYNSTDGYYLKDTDGKYRKIATYAEFSPTDPEADKITKDQRGVTR